MIELQEHNNKQYASLLQIHTYLNVSKQFSQWAKISIKNANLIENEDFLTYKLESTGGRKTTDFLLTERSAIRIVLQSRMPKSIELETILIDTFKKRQNLEYVTPKEAAYAFEFINCLKFVNNQKKAYTEHKDYYVKTNPSNKYIYSEFAKERANIVGWNKEKVDQAVKDYLTTHAGHNFTKLMKMSMSDKLSIIDINEAIRVAVLDVLFVRGTNKEIAQKFASLVKNISQEMNIIALRKDEVNLFQQKENINLKSLPSK